MIGSLCHYKGNVKESVTSEEVDLRKNVNLFLFKFNLNDACFSRGRSRILFLFFESNINLIYFLVYSSVYFKGR